MRARVGRRASGPCAGPGRDTSRTPREQWPCAEMLQLQVACLIAWAGCVGRLDPRLKRASLAKAPLADSRLPLVSWNRFQGVTSGPSCPGCGHLLAWPAFSRSLVTASRPLSQQLCS